MFYKFMGGRTQRLFDLFYLKCACQYYRMIAQLGWSMKMFRMFDSGPWQISKCLMEAMKYFTIMEHFNPLAIIVDNSLRNMTFFTITEYFTPPPSCNCWQLPKNDKETYNIIILCLISEKDNLWFTSGRNATMTIADQTISHQSSYNVGVCEYIIMSSRCLISSRPQSV